MVEFAGPGVAQARSRVRDPGLQRRERPPQGTEAGLLETGVELRIECEHSPKGRLSVQGERGERG